MFGMGQKVKAEVTEFLDWIMYEENDTAKTFLISIAVWLMIANSITW